MTPATLRKLYEASIDDGLYGARMEKVNVSFDDYFAFLRMESPLATRRTAATNAARPAFQELAATIPVDPPAPDPPERNDVWIERKPKVALDKIAIDPKCQGLHLDRIKAISGWASLTRLRSLRHLGVLVCESTDTNAAQRKMRLETLELGFTSFGCVKSVLSSVDAADVSIGDVPGVVNLAALPLGRRMTHLSVGAALLRGVSCLARRPIEELSLGYVEVDDELRTTVASLAPTLRRLHLTPTKLFHPEELGDLSRMKALRHVLAHASREHRAAWIDFAVAHPKVGFSFSDIEPPTGEVCTLEVLHRRVDILRIARKGKKPSFEVAGDLASQRRRYRGSNGDLEDELRAAAKKVGKRIAWSSENDMLVGRAADVETCRWIIDRALDGPTARS